MKALRKIVVVVMVCLLASCGSFVSVRGDCDPQEVRWEPSAIVGVGAVVVLSALAAGAVAASVVHADGRTGQTAPVQ